MRVEGLAWGLGIGVLGCKVWGLGLEQTCWQELVMQEALNFKNPTVLKLEKKPSNSKLCTWTPLTTSPRSNPPLSTAS